MKHRVENAELICIHTSRPFSNGATYKVEKDKTAIISFPFSDKQEIKVSGPCILRVDHFGEIKKG
jgi:hypothetical protein